MKLEDILNESAADSNCCSISVRLKNDLFLMANTISSLSKTNLYELLKEELNYELHELFKRTVTDAEASLFINHLLTENKLRMDDIINNTGDSFIYYLRKDIEKITKIDK